MEKRILFLCIFLLVISVLHAQDELTCDLIFESNYDRIEKRTMFTSLVVSTKVLNNYGKINMTIHYTSEIAGFLFSFGYIGDLACINEGKRIVFLFEDDTNLEFENAYRYNCDGLASINFFKESKNFAQIKKLKTNKLIAVRIYFDTGFKDADISLDKAEFIRKAIECATQ